MKKAKKIIAVAMALVMALSTAAFAAAGEKLGVTTYTNVVTYINHYAIPSFNYNGYTFIVAEDLQNYGFDVIWNSANNTLRIFRNESDRITPTPTYKNKKSMIGKNFFDVLTTNTRTYIGDYAYEIECLGGISGYTLINVENLSAFGEVTWVPQANAMKVWIEDGLKMRYTPQAVEFDPSQPDPPDGESATGFGMYPKYPDVPNFGAVTGAKLIDVNVTDISTMYIYDAYSAAPKLKNYAHALKECGFNFLYQQDDNDGYTMVFYMSKTRLLTIVWGTNGYGEVDFGVIVAD